MLQRITARVGMDPLAPGNWLSAIKVRATQWGKRSSLLSIVLLSVAIIAAGYAFLSYRPITVKVAGVSENVPIRIFGLGTVEARVLSKVGFEVGAAITELNADHGDIVKEGTVLARLHSTQQDAKVARAKAVLISNEAAIKKAEVNLTKTRAILAQRLTANRRKQQLVESRATTPQLAEEAQRDEDVAKADVLVAESDIEVAKAQLSDARSQYNYEKAVLDQHTLTAPFDALVIDRLKELGTVIKAGDAIFTLVASDSVWALAYVDESRAGAIREGQAAEVRLRSLPQQVFPARVVRIGIESDRVSEERRVYVKCDVCPVRFHLGEQAEVLIQVATLEKATLVPESAVTGFDGRKGTVWTVEDGRLARRAVSFGHRTQDARLQIVGGLPDGALVVTEISATLQEGRSARALAETKR
jgi:HlyD family secretion protein